MKKNVTLMVLLPFLLLTACQESKAMEGETIEVIVEAGAAGIERAWSWLQRYRATRPNAAIACQDEDGKEPEENSKKEMTLEQQWDALQPKSLLPLLETIKQRPQREILLPKFKNQSFVKQAQQLLSLHISLNDLQQIIMGYYASEPNCAETFDVDHPLIEKFLNGEQCSQTVRVHKTGDSMGYVLTPYSTWPHFTSLVGQRFGESTSKQPFRAMDSSDRPVEKLEDLVDAFITNHGIMYYKIP